MTLPKLTGKLLGMTEQMAKLQSLPEAIRTELRTSVKKLGFQLELLVKRKLSGPVLKAPTGNLRGSINTRIEERGDETVAIVGTSVGVIPYARIHEFGGIIEAKNASYLIFKTPDGAWHKVKSVQMPERSYLRSSLNDMRNGIRTELQAAVRRGYRRAGF